MTLPTRADDTLLDDLHAAIAFAPLHLPTDIASITAARRRWPALPHLACFDTTFHRTMPAEVRRLPLPADVVATGVRRYGFHGLSMQHVVDVVPDLGRGVVAHLGGGCSATAVRDGRSLRTSMSFTRPAACPQAAEPATSTRRSCCFLLAQGHSIADGRNLLQRRSGIAGIAGTEPNVEAIIQAATRGDRAAQQALAVFTADVANTTAGYTSALNGLDTLVFTGGIGEHAAVVRSAVTTGPPTWACTSTHPPQRPAISPPPVHRCAHWWSPRTKKSSGPAGTRTTPLSSGLTRGSAMCSVPQVRG